MKRILTSIILFTLVFLVFITPGDAAKSDLPEYVRKQLHNDIKHTVITEKNIDKIDEILANKKPRHFLVLQIKPDMLTNEHAEKLLSWVKEGGVLWFYDSRLSSFFGMESSPLEKEKFKGDPHKGDYGSGKVNGVNAIAYADPVSEHPVKNGTWAVQAFLMEVDKDRYSAVAANTPGVIPIFRVNEEQKAIVAIKKEGEGWIVFKPLLWLDALGSERLQVNLLEFSAGYPVPSAETNFIPPDALEGKPVKLSRYDNLFLSNGQQLLGMVMNRKFEIVGAEKPISKKVSEINSIMFSLSGNEMKLNDGTTYRGFITDKKINFKTITGKVIDIDREQIASIKFNVGETKPKEEEESPTSK